MSLAEVYQLAHTAECRLNISASRPDRNLRFVVGHLMHYESLRLRIVEIEHDISKTQRAQTRLGQTTSAQAQQQMASADNDDEVIDDEDFYGDDAGIDDSLGLTRFPSGSSRPPPLVADEDDEDDREEPVSPEEPDEVAISQALKRHADADLATQMEKVRQCPCHGHTDAPHIENVWELPASPNDKPGITRAIAQEAG